MHVHIHVSCDLAAAAEYVAQRHVRYTASNDQGEYFVCVLGSGGTDTSHPGIIAFPYSSIAQLSIADSPLAHLSSYSCH